jgi:hypothetical protein
MYAERALVRGEDSEEVIRRIADFRSSETKRDMDRGSAEATRMRESEQIDVWSQLAYFITR